MTPIVSRWKNIFAVAIALAIVGCSKEPASSTPLVEQSAADQKAADQKAAGLGEFRGSFAPRGIHATYRATFSEGQIKTLEETRDTAGASSRGNYEFQGARLLKYQGAALGSNDDIQLEFDLQGKVLAARAGDKDASPEEISAIRDRAQSLRSHAVAQYAVRGHEQK
jgi:hypothetical protein